MAPRWRARGRDADVVEQFGEALRLSPDFAEAQRNLEAALYDAERRRERRP